jgi:hypothetical protein
MKIILKPAASAVLILACLCIVAKNAAAHHGYALFDTSTRKTVSGTVRQFIWMNPHSWVWLDVKNTQGGVDAWGFEGMSPNYLGRRGWTRETLKPGDPITVTFYPFKSASQKGGAFLSAKRPNGEELDMYLPDPSDH